MLIAKEDCEKLIENQYGYLYLKDGVLYRFFNRKTTLDLEVAKQCLEDRKVLVGDKKYPVFYDLTNVKSITRQARQYLAHPDFTANIVSWAFYTKSPVMKKIIYFFMTINKPKVPVRSFIKVEEATLYLQTIAELQVLQEKEQVINN